MNGNNVNQSQKSVQENGCNSWTMNGSLDNNRNLQYNLSQEEGERNDERIMNLYKKAAKNTEENFRKLLKESREGIAPTFLLPSETAVIRPTSTFGSRDELKNIVKECLREILNENNQEMPSFSQKRPPQNLSITDVNVVVPQQQNGSQQQHQPLPSISTMFDGRRSSAATPINEIERQQMALSRTTTPLPLRFQQPNLRLQTRMTFTSPTSLLPPIPPAPPTLQSPIFRAQNGNGGSSSSSQAAQVNQSQIPACCRYPPPLPLPPGISLEQYHVHLFLQAQRNRFPYPQPPPPTPTPTPTTKSNTIAENLQTAGNNPYLQQFPRIPLDQSEHERLNQMFYANLLRPPTMQPPNSMHSQQSQQQPQQQQPPSTPTPTKRTRKRKSSPEKCPSVLSKPSDIISQQQNQSSTFPLTANIQQQTNNGPVLSSAVELFQPQESEERLINVIQNPNVTVEENENNNNNENADHDSDDIIIIEHEQSEPNPSHQRTPGLETPPPKLCIADEEQEEDENEEPPPSKIRALTFSKSAIPPPNLSTSPPMTTSPLTTSSPSTSEASPSPDITFNLETIKELCEAHFIDKPMLKGYYKILQEQRPKDLPKYLSTIGFAHNLQDSKKTTDNFFEFGKSNATKLLAQAKQDPPKCSKCREMDVPLPETLISYLEEVVEKSSNNSDEMAKHALLKVIKFTCDALSNAMEKIFNSTKFYIGSPSPPLITKEIRNAIESAFKSADNYEKCSIIWNSEPLKNIKIGVAEEFYRLRILSDDEKKTIVKHCECEHEWIYKRPNTRRGRRLIDYD